MCCPHVRVLLQCFNVCVCVIASQPVDIRLCKGTSPSTTQLCHIPCPVECELSPWGAWGPCTFENCDERVVKKGKHDWNNNIFTKKSLRVKYWETIKSCFAVYVLLNIVWETQIEPEYNISFWFHYYLKLLVKDAALQHISSNRATKMS